MQLIEKRQVQLDQKEVEVVTGAVSGMYSMNEAIIMHDGAQLFWAATLEVAEEGNLLIYYVSNSEAHQANFPSSH